MKRKWWSRKERDAGRGYQQTGDTVSWDIAMAQAVMALDHAAELSIKTKSPSGMREVAIGWLAVASSLSEASDTMEEHDLDGSDNNEVYPLGFRGPSPVDEEEEDDYGRHEDYKGKNSSGF